MSKTMEQDLSNYHDGCKCQHCETIRRAEGALEKAEHGLIEALAGPWGRAEGAIHTQYELEAMESKYEPGVWSKSAAVDALPTVKEMNQEIVKHMLDKMPDGALQDAFTYGIGVWRIGPNGLAEHVPLDDPAAQDAIDDWALVNRPKPPVTTGFLDYFPDAIRAVAAVSAQGNAQHGTTGWDRSKSSDHPNCLGRHFLERGKLDTDGHRHSAKVAWRALALLQEEIEADRA